jgi:hypothetical protein
MAQADKIPAPWFSALKEVLHWYAWKLNPANSGNAGATNGIDYFQTTTYSILLIFCCFIATQSSVFKFPERLQMNVKKLIIFFIALYFLQAVSFELNISQLFSISFGRFSIFTSIFSVIIFSSCISFLTQNNSQKIIFSSLLIFCLIIPSNLNLALFAFILLINELRQTNHKNTFKFAVTFFIILTIIFSRADYNDDWWIGSIYKFIPFSFHTVPNYLALKMIEYLSMYSWLLILAILIVYSIYKINSHKNYFIVGVIIFLTILTLGGRYVLSDRRSETHNDWLETQLWALNHSKVNSKFIINSGFDLYESWTTLTRRPRLIADLSAGFLYFYTKEDQEYDVSRSQLPDAPSPTSEASKIENFYLLFGHKYGADYLVWKNKYTPLTFKKVYMNSQYVVYQLPDN